MRTQKIATVFGGTGFVGRHVVSALAGAGYHVRIATRYPQKAYFLKPYGDVGQISAMAVSMNDPASLDAVIAGADTVIFLPGVLHAGGLKGFMRIHAEFPAQVAQVCANHHVKHLVHISALGCERGDSLYAQSKRAGEKAVLEAFPSAVILRPSIVFGLGDNFFARFAGMAKILPFLPLIGGGLTKFQPVYVGDVARAVMVAITAPLITGIYELAGPSVYTFKELMQKICDKTGEHPLLLSIPYWLATLQGAVFERLPGVILTRDQVKSLKSDNVASKQQKGFETLGITPLSLETVLPVILSRFMRNKKV